MIRLTAEAHAAVRAVLAVGEAAVDATAGNGHDTLFLANVVGPAGRVWAFDVQPAALARTAALLEGISHVELVPRDHAEMMNVIPERHRGRVGAVMFNLGYLPGGDQAVATRAGSTAAAVRAALQLLRPGGVLTVIAYPGHPGGPAELAAVRDALAAADVRAVTPPGADAPTLFVVRRGVPAFGRPT